MFVDEAKINAERREIYVQRIQDAIRRIGVIDGCDAMMLATDLVTSFDFALRHHLAEWSRVELRPQIGMGTREWVRVRGRVAEKSAMDVPRTDEEPFDVLVSCWYRFLISDMPPTPILAKSGEREVLTATDEEGFFDVTLTAQPELGDFQGYLVELEVGDQATVRAEKETCEVQVPPAKSTTGLLVDLDGVILDHPRGRFAQVLAEVILGHGRRRRIDPLDGLGDLVSRMTRGDGAPNPVFYISNAPRHLYSHLRIAMDYAGLPSGYLQLRDFDLRLRTLTSEKTDFIEMVLAHEIIDHYPEFDFIFIGTTDRVEHYASAVQAMGSRLEAVYLLGEPDAPHEALDELGVRLAVGGGDDLLADAAEHGFIDE